MADAPEVVPGILSTDRSPEQQPYHGDRKETQPERESSPLERSINQPEKELGFSPEDEVSKHAIAPDQHVGSGIEALELAKEEKEIVSASPLKADIEPDMEHTRTEKNAETTLQNDWHHGFWEWWRPSGIWIEALVCPCFLAGRTHQRLHEPEATHLPSVNSHCATCFGTTFLLVVGAPIYALMTTAQRREIRYRHHIKGSNADDCWRSTFCVSCALVQEEKEIQWQIQRRSKEAERATGMTRRTDQMEYNRG